MKEVVTDLHKRSGSKIIIEAFEITRNLKIQYFENFPLSYGCFFYIVASKTDTF